ncbi:aminotransferase class I/II-fold pyridoxal phosphate-dependent enzyme [Mogibacterium neglectum]|uniref:aminotransferase class I/II-fold pyridoxal phosphate-dependent enzyme n=1 Tax=Mogibacterium neglectum TaxID=114528 RepID=UPI00272C5480|nr:aminotransferase class I/II-fold pyridoxal phosphate-dependent enzyme [Mogibacterium neglectum]WLD76392.1 aminotransferase class I/II-fold pyridoxal phosphate-dependent enzyme [Mogibacterium neglectum]
MKDRVSLTDFLMYHKETHPISFHMPGHKGRSTLYGIYGFGDFIKNVVGNDITEISGADALQQPRERIKYMMEGYAGLYGAKHTEILVNGSSVGLMAAILGSVPRGDKLLMGRNSHRSVYGALRLGGIDPVYIMPEIDDETGLQLGLDPDKIEGALIEDPDIKAVLVTSPNYYGVLSDIERIASIVHLHGRILIVDQAHGAHLKFFDYLRSEDGLPHRAAENCGADIVVDSTHKTLLSFTGSAILNICTERTDVIRISEFLRMLQTTSPSYLMMGSLDINQQILRMDGYNLIKNWDTDIKYFYQEAARIAGLGLIDRIGLDKTKVNITMSALGLSGPELAEELEKRNIWVELTHGDYVMLMTGIGNERGDYEDVLTALRDLSVQYSGRIQAAKSENTVSETDSDAETADQKNPNTAVKSEAQMTPSSNSVFTEQLEQRKIPDAYEEIPLYNAEGRVLYESIIPYPPGSPIACPGEVLSKSVILYVRDQLVAQHVVLGVDEEGRVKVESDCVLFKEI